MGTSRTSKTTQDDYFWTNSPDWHATRQQNILKDHPEVKRLFGIDENTKYLGMLLVFLQLFVSVLSMKLAWPAYLFSVYFFGATLMQAAFLLVHECSHNLLFHSTLHNRLFSYFAQLAIPIPFSESFRYYHLKHHSDHTEEGIDTDIPTKMEANFTRMGPIFKVIWMQFNVVFYAIRPSLLMRMPLTKFLAWNWAVQILFNLFVYFLFGMSPILYSLLSVFIAGGIHPLAGHFLCEHYIMKGIPHGQETISYYGPLNFFIWNAGHHVEHHDFKSVPWSRLPVLRHIAPLYYDSLQTYDSYVSAIYSFITDETVSGFSRVKRKTTKEAS